MAAHAADSSSPDSFHGPVSGQLACPQDTVSGLPGMGVGVGVGVGGGWWELGETERWRESTGRRYTFFRTPKSQNIISSTLFARRGSLRPAHTGELKIEFYFLQKGLSKTYLKITSLRPVGFSTESCTNVSYAPCSSRMGSFHH